MTQAFSFLQCLLGQIQGNYPDVTAIYVAVDDDGDELVVQVILDGEDEYEPIEDYITVGLGQEDRMGEIYFEARRELGAEYDMTVTLMT